MATYLAATFRTCWDILNDGSTLAAFEGLALDKSNRLNSFITLCQLSVGHSHTLRRTILSDLRITSKHAMDLLNRFPSDIVELIASHLSARDLCNLRSMSKCWETNTFKAFADCRYGKVHLAATAKRTVSLARVFQSAALAASVKSCKFDFPYKAPRELATEGRTTRLPQSNHGSVAEQFACIELLARMSNLECLQLYVPQISFP